MFLDRIRPCNDVTLYKELTDSLKAKGYKLIDSTQALDKLTNFLRATFKYDRKVTTSDLLREVDRAFSANKLYQGIAVEKYSCLDTLHNYTISVYVAPRNTRSRLSQNFTLPSKSSYSISSIILSMIDLN